jgi:hypothetical protein
MFNNFSVLSTTLHVTIFETPLFGNTVFNQQRLWNTVYYNDG